MVAVKNVKEELSDKICLSWIATAFILTSSEIDLELHAQFGRLLTHWVTEAVEKYFCVKFICFHSENMTGLLQECQTNDIIA